MATLLRTSGVRFFLPSRDHAWPPHVHAEYGDCASAWRLDTLECVKQSGCTDGDERKIRTVLLKYREPIKEAWHAEWHKRTQGR